MERLTYQHDERWCIDGKKTASDTQANCWGDAIDRLAAYENTGISYEELQEVVDLFNEFVEPNVPLELTNWMERCTWHVKKCDELRKEIEQLRATKTAESVLKMREEKHRFLLSPFGFDPFALVWLAFKNLYPDKDCSVYWEPEIRDAEDGSEVFGLTNFGDDGTIDVFVKPTIGVLDAVEVLAHELAHVAVGVEHDHDSVWDDAFEAIHQQYNQIGDALLEAIKKDSETKEDNTTMNIVVITHNPAGQKLLFCVPEDKKLKKDDKVMVKTQRGLAMGTCICDSFECDYSAAEALCSVLGGRMPLAPVIGKYTLERWDDETSDA
ncbi:MAG: hypothetical protein E7449_01030 [Ruminococcaceae bacterium]|nr:hypothetical protein [Oscillospiraceae bacterium]